MGKHIHATINKTGRKQRETATVINNNKRINLCNIKYNQEVTDTVPGNL